MCLQELMRLADPIARFQEPRNRPDRYTDVHGSHGSHGNISNGSVPSVNIRVIRVQGQPSESGSPQHPLARRAHIGVY